MLDIKCYIGFLDVKMVIILYNLKLNFNESDKD